MVVKDVAASEFELLAQNGYPNGVPIGDGFDEDDDSSQSLSTFVAGLDEAWGAVARLGLQRHAVEIQTLGYTVIKPEHIGSSKFTQEALRATLDVAKRRRGVEYNIVNGVPELDLYGHGADKEANERYILLESDKYLLFEDRVFEQIILNEQVLALFTLLLGSGRTLDRMYSLYRHGNTPALPLHTDGYDQSPFTSSPSYMAATWCLTDFMGAHDGATCYVPGTHRFNRRPTKHESYKNIGQSRSIYAPAGSVLLHNGSVWHGAPTRRAEGVRVSVNLFYNSGNLPPADGYRGKEPEGMLERNPLRFAQLLGHKVRDGEILTRGEVIDGLQGEDRVYDASGASETVYGGGKRDARLAAGIKKGLL